MYLIILFQVLLTAKCPMRYGDKWSFTVCRWWFWRRWMFLYHPSFHSTQSPEKAFNPAPSNYEARALFTRPCSIKQLSQNFLATKVVLISHKIHLTYSITFLLLPTWYTNFLFIHINYIKLNSSTRFKRNPLIRTSTTQIIHMQPLVSSLSASDRLVQPLRKDCFLSGCTRRSLAESDDTRGCICTICVVDILMMSGLHSKHVEEFNFM